MRHLLRSSTLILAGLLLTSVTRAQIIVSTIPNIDLSLGYGTNSAFTSTFGQTFVAPGTGTTKFDAFEFVIQRNNPRNTPLTLTAHIAAYDETTQRIVGPILASSGANYYDNIRGKMVFRVPMRQTQLVAGQKYIAFASVASQGNYFWQIATSNPYAGGNMVYNGDVLGGATNTWGTFTANGASAPADLGTRLFFDMPYYSNIALGKPVTLNGSFGSSSSFASSLTDGVYRPQGTGYQNGTVWWANNNASAIVDLGGLYTINAFNIQADDNDAYVIEYRSSASAPWEFAWSVHNSGPGPNGMQTRPDEAYGNARFFLEAPIVASQFRLRGDSSSSDVLYALSEFQAYGVAAVPEPSSLAFAVAGIGFCGLLSRRRRK